MLILLLVVSGAMVATLILDSVREELGLDGSVPISVVANASGGEDTALFDVAVRSDDPGRAADIARAVPIEFAASARTYAPTLAQSGDTVAAQFVDEPTVAGSPVEPDVTRNLLIAIPPGSCSGCCMPCSPTTSTPASGRSAT